MHLRAFHTHYMPSFMKVIDKLHSHSQISNGVSHSAATTVHWLPDTLTEPRLRLHARSSLPAAAVSSPSPRYATARGAHHAKCRRTYCVVLVLCLLTAGNSMVCSLTSHQWSALSSSQLLDCSFSSGLLRTAWRVRGCR